MTRQFFALKISRNTHILSNPGEEERKHFTQGLTYHSAISSLSPNFLLHLYADSGEYSDPEKRLASALAEAYLLAEVYLADNAPTNEGGDRPSGPKI